MLHFILSRRGTYGSMMTASVLDDLNKRSPVKKKWLVIVFDKFEETFWNNILGHEIQLLYLKRCEELEFTTTVLEQYNGIVIDNPCQFGTDSTVSKFLQSHQSMDLNIIVSTCLGYVGIPTTVKDGIDFLHIYDYNYKIIVKNLSGWNEIRESMRFKLKLDMVSIDMSTNLHTIRKFDKNFLREQYRLRTILKGLYNIPVSVITNFSRIENDFVANSRIVRENPRKYNEPVTYGKTFEKDSFESIERFESFQRTMATLYRMLDDPLNSAPRMRFKVQLNCAKEIYNRNEYIRKIRTTPVSNISFGFDNEDVTYFENIHACDEKKEVDRKEIEGDCVICFTPLINDHINPWAVEGSLYAKKEAGISWCTRGCGNNFHNTCIDTWLLKKKTCPFCRKGMAKY